MVERTLTLGNTELKLKYPNSAVRKMDAELGVSSLNLLTEGFRTGESRLSRMDVLAVIIWAGLITDKPATRIETIVDIIPMEIPKYLGVVNEVAKILSKIYRINDVEADAEVLEGEDAPGNPTGQPGAGHASNA